MKDVRVATTTGAESVIAGDVVEAFKASLHGQLLRPGDHGYDEARKVWNGMIDKRPALIARCAGVADVIQAVNVVRTHRLLVSVRDGGAAALRARAILTHPYADLKTDLMIRTEEDGNGFIGGK